MKRFIKDVLLENWSLKAIAVLLSLVLWLLVRGEPGPERVVAIPLEIQLPRHMEITNERPTTVEVTMRGAAFSNVLFSQPLPNCIIDLQGAKEGEHIVKLSPENVRVPKGSGIEVLQLNPARVHIVLQQTINKEVPITVPIRGQPAAAYEKYGTQIKPSSVIITGPRSHIEPVDKVSTEAVSIQGLKDSKRFFVSLNLKDNFIRTSFNNPIQVDVQIGPRRQLFTISEIHVATNDPAYTTVPKQVSVQVDAPVDLGRSLTPEDFSVTVDTKNLSSSNLPARLKPDVRLNRNLNGQVIVKEVQPPEVVVQQANNRH